MRTCVLCHCAATVYCVNDDANLCADCDVKFHANPLTARHERRTVASLNDVDRFSVCPDSSDDLAVVPQCGPAAPLPTASENLGMVPDFLDSFGGPGEMSITDLLSLDAPNTFLDDLVFGDVPAPQSDAFADQGLALVPELGFTPQMPAAANPFNTSYAMNDMMFMSTMVPQMVPEPAPAQEDFEEDIEEDMAPLPQVGATTRSGLKRDRETAATGAAAPEPELTREQRVQRYREKRARRNFRKTIRYQSRKAYAEVRPRIKGRFVSPEEYAEYMRGKQEDVAVVPAC